MDYIIICVKFQLSISYEFRAAGGSKMARNGSFTACTAKPMLELGLRTLCALIMRGLQKMDTLPEVKISALSPITKRGVQN